MKKTNFPWLLANFTASLLLLFIPIIINAQTIVYRDSSAKFLTDYNGKLKVAKVPPTIDFGVIEVGDASPNLNFAHWGNVVYGPDDKYYYAIGDLGSTVILKSYNPKSKTDTICIYSPNVVPKLADGKWHGRPTIDPNTGDMYLIGFNGGQVVKYNIYSKEVKNYGQMVSGVGWEEHIWDYESNRLYGINGDILVYDTANDTVIFSGKPFADFALDSRARMVDTETGMFYGTGNKGSFYKYNPNSNVFTKLNSSLPGEMRASTNIKEADGSFWIFDKKGDMYKFFPDKDSIAFKGVNDEEGQYVTFLERSTDGEFLYYMNALDNNHLIQYNTLTTEKKVIAQLPNYYSINYNYNIMACYGGALSKDGSSILLVCMGMGTDGKTRPAIFHVHIPESERLLPRLDATYLMATTCDPKFVGIDTVALFDQYGKDSLVITETSLLPPEVQNIIESINEGESIQIGDSIFTISGHYSVTFTNQYGCDSLISLYLTVVKPVNIISLNEKKSYVKIYPNPTKGDVSLSIENIIVDTRINIISDKGQIVFDKEYCPVEGQKIEQIDLKKYPNGIYIIQVISNEIIEQEKLILNR